MSPRAVKIFFDGGARPNPGRMEAAVVAYGVTHYLADLGHGTSTDAEWLALIAALGVAQSLALPHFVLLGDSATVIDQANRRSPCRSPGLKAHLDRFEAMGGTRHSKIRWIARTQNLAGIALDAQRR
jgi:ribonuclease HI